MVTFRTFSFLDFLADLLQKSISVASNLFACCMLSHIYIIELGRTYSFSAYLWGGLQFFISVSTVRLFSLLSVISWQCSYFAQSKFMWYALAVIHHSDAVANLKLQKQP
jgi:hypothetical protein